MATITRGNHAKFLEGLVKDAFGNDYPTYPEKNSMVYDVQTSNRMYEEYAGLVGLGLLQKKTEGGEVSMETMRQGFTQRLDAVTRALGYSVSFEALDDQSGMLKNRIFNQNKLLTRSAFATMEKEGALILDRAFDNSYTGPDGLELCSTAHLYAASTGSTWQNEPTSAADLSVSSLEQAYIDIGDWEDDKGIPMNANPQLLIIPNAERFNAKRILKSTQDPDSANNAVNPINSENLQMIVWNFLSDSDAWFLKTDLPGLVMVKRKDMDIESWVDNKTKSVVNDVVMRFIHGWFDPHAIYGSPGQ